MHQARLLPRTLSFTLVYHFVRLRLFFDNVVDKVMHEAAPRPRLMHPFTAFNADTTRLTTEAFGM